MEYLGYALALWIFVGHWMRNARHIREMASRKKEDLMLARTVRRISHAIKVGVVLADLDGGALVDVAGILEDRYPNPLSSN